MRKLAVVLLGSSTVAAALIVAACSSSDTSDVPVPTVDANKGDTSPNGGDANSGEDTGTDGGTGADCGTVPTLHAPGDGGFYCPFLAKDAGSYCTNGETCCDPDALDSGVYPVSFCAAGQLTPPQCASAASTYNSQFVDGFFSYAFQCDDNTACTTPDVCVATVSAFISSPTEVVNVGHTTKAPASCTADKTVFQLNGTQCMASGTAPASSKFVCSTQADCTTVAPGTTCVPATVSSRTLGICTAP